MKTYLKLSTSAVALLGAALLMGNPAYADGNWHHRDRHHHQTVSNVSVDVNQSSSGDIAGSSSNSAVLDSHYGDHLSGNVGINNVAGTGNAQENASAINASSSTDKTYVKTDVDQSVGGWFFGMQDNTSNSPNLAEITDNALSHASGNIAVNNAAGHGNLQSNTLAIAVTGKTASASADIDQDVSGSDQQNGTYKYVKVRDRHHDKKYGNNFFDRHHDDYKKVATYNPQAIIDSNALQDASGNVAVNNVAGNGNAQSNALSIVQGKTVSASGTARQDVYAWDNSGGSNPVMNLGKIGGNALQNATGNIAVNNAAGDFNAQSGAVIIAAAVSGGSLGDMSAKVSQSVFVPSGGYNHAGNVNTASLTGNALEYASGAISVNNAAGVGNAQSNMLVLGAK